MLKVKYMCSFAKLHNTTCFFILRRGCSKGTDNKDVFLGTPGSPSALAELKKQNDEFRTLLIPGHNYKLPEARQHKTLFIHKLKIPRKQFMKIDQDWTDVWPTAATFNPSVVPLPIRQGNVKGPSDNEGIPPGPEANVELMKIPNFLHLTPAHIKKHCKALKQFCTKWPTALKTDEDMEKYFPVQVVNRTYIADGVSPRDFRGRLVTLKVKLSFFNLDGYALDKIKRLLGERYDSATDTITLSADRCPSRIQNYDYLQYLLTALYFESTTIQDWEVKEPHDMEVYDWNVQASRENVLDFIQRSVQVKEEAGENVPEVVSSVRGESEEEIVSHPSIQRLQEAANRLHNEGESEETLTGYKDAIKQVLLGKMGQHLPPAPEADLAAAH